MLKKIRFIEPGNYSPYKKSPANVLTYNKYIRNPSTGLITLATIVKKRIDNTLMYSESISKIQWNDIYDADIVFIGINTFNAVRGYAIAKQIRQYSLALIVFGGMHASLNYMEAVEYGDYVLTGDGDELILEFIEYCGLKSKDQNTTIQFPGVIYRQNGQVINTGIRIQPENIKPHELQEEIIIASSAIYSLKRLLYALFHYKWIDKILFIGECIWQKSMRKDLRKELSYLKTIETNGCTI